MHDDYIARGCHYKMNGKEKLEVCTSGSCNKLHAYNWLDDVPESLKENDFVEIRFKNTRKDFYINVNKLRLVPGDIVAVEAFPGHDIGVVSLVGEIVGNQLKKYQIDPSKTEFKKIYRKAKLVDIEKWKEAISEEHKTMIHSRKIAEALKLEMKIGDVEYQGDKTKAIFYYIANERVDFRELIKKLADEFKIRVEMKQIGARQEAGRIGGIGSCGRELCCASWMSDFVSVTTNAARYQEVSLNPQKLAGQCSKLKCCLNYELPTYLDAQKDFPNKDIVLETIDGFAYHQKTDVFRRIMWYSFDKSSSANLQLIPVERVLEIIKMNKNGKKPDKLLDLTENELRVPLDYQNSVGQDSLTRFQNQNNKKKKKNNKRKKKPGINRHNK